ncbi:TonB-dependent receptor [Marixanthomonas spongiae]|uniref:TonB-dependent receptor n=1 Tax=Marixanthomonas spongiae TaxID=2174845 RepID=A0A2U0HU81_9FLAO|nr:TonB-dependent receptor [Marixanthomonas spongiae]PVW12397.1 TonB-dependent receptor [Marixanthomonas spongiae]
MKIIIWTTFWVCMGLQTGFAQNLKGTVTNENGDPLRNVNISILEANKGTTTNEDGYFELDLVKGNYDLYISFIGYKPKTLPTKVKSENNNINIQLEPDFSVLNEVVVSASREAQLRSAVPAAIGIIGNQSISETKAFGIDQLVNQVSGVFMSTSRAASNEQHFMAVRSPISTRALFLYLEDGLQIRPTSVFNHNALLEMNDISYKRIEVLKGPASSIYGSESIGGSFNFITKSPTPELTATLGYQVNDIGLSRYEIEISDKTSNKFGFYFGSHFAHRTDGPIEHSDYEKFAVTFKTVYDISDRLNWTNVFDLIDYRSDTTGSLTEDDYFNGNFESDQTFTERDVLSFRMRSTLTARWNDHQKTTFNTLFRNNKIDQNPFYRIRQFREMGQLTGFGLGEINSNQFNSYMALVQHRLQLDFKNSSLIVGGTIDYSPQDYVAENIDVIVDTKTGRNVAFSVRQNDFILNYKADILNYAGFFQYEIEPLEHFRVTAALRYDSFKYDYQNRSEHLGVPSSKDTYDNWAPKLGVNYNFENGNGLYANYSRGFTPPQVSTLYRNRNGLRDIKPSLYDNYEIGGYFRFSDKWKLDAAIYLLEGKNTLITLRDEQDDFFNTNAGKTRSYGIEYGITYSPFEKMSVSHKGSYAFHRYVKFFDGGKEHSNTDRETAPNLLGTSLVTYRPFRDFSVTAEHELVGDYNTSFENEIIDDKGTMETATYNGHNIFNIRATYRYGKVEVWAHLLNVFDKLYATEASYNQFRRENSFTIGNPRTFHLGVRLHL